MGGKKGLMLSRVGAGVDDKVCRSKGDLLRE